MDEKIHDAIEFLKDRGFGVFSMRDGFNIWLSGESSERSNRLFVEKDELEVIQSLGKIVRIEVDTVAMHIQIAK